jgi:hypothetical protein
MSTYLDPALEIHRLFQQPEGGIVGVADQLLQKCRDHHVRMEWAESGLRIQIDSGPWQLLQGLALRKSIFRALLARLALLSNESGKPCSPYGGSGEISIADDYSIMIQLTNTPEQQQLALNPLKSA